MKFDRITLDKYDVDKYYWFWYPNRVYPVFGNLRNIYGVTVGDVAPFDINLLRIIEPSARFKFISSI